MVKAVQNHLKFADTINLGSYYTPKWVVDVVYKMLSNNIGNVDDYKILDTSCGYGNFLRGINSIGADIDPKAVEIAKQQFPEYTFFNHNSLQNISREQYNLDENDKVIVVGNPPYNDTTSIIRNDIKEEKFIRDKNVVSRDLGISFLLSYNIIRPDYVCVLHPLSYLIKKANFESLLGFKKNYKLIDGVIISSGIFAQTSKTTCFPIIIAFYEKSSSGMDYSYICNYNFKTIDGKTFSLNQFDKVSNYITKYPNQKSVELKNTIAFFWTMRDINALKRTKTFVENEIYNTIRVTKSAFPYYCYVDVFKDYITHMPYYFGNCDVMIDNNEFKKIQHLFVLKSAKKHNHLNHAGTDISYSDSYDVLIENYFRKLLGEHYVD